MDKGGWVSLSGILGKSFLQAYTTNYNGFKDKFLRVENGERCPRVMYVLDRNYHFLIYLTDKLLSVSSFDYDKLNSLETRALAILDAFRVVKVKNF